MSCFPAKHTFWFTLMCLFYFIIIYTPIFLTAYLENENYHPTNCTTYNIEYPTSYDNDTHWGVCTCRRRCKAHSPVISIYVNVENKNETYLLNKNYIQNDYTFHNDKCPDGNTPGYTRVLLDEAKTIYNEYKNKTFTCYFNEEKNSVCLEKEDLLWTIGNYAIWSICGILVICGSCNLVCNYKSIC